MNFSGLGVLRFGVDFLGFRPSYMHLKTDAHAERGQGPLKEGKDLLRCSAEHARRCGCEDIQKV